MTVAVEIVDAAPQALSYAVRNDGDAAVWLVDDGWLVYRQKGRRIELSFARPPMQPGAVPFGYFPPKVAELPTGEATQRTVALEWPRRLDRLWNAAGEAAPEPGEYEVTVRIGYGETPAPPPPTDDVEAPVLRWQQEAVSPPVPLVVP